MRYNEKFRREVVSYVHDGGTRVDASQLFGVSQPTIRKWLRRGDNLVLKTGRPRKLDYDALRKAVTKDPHRPVPELAAKFGVYDESIRHALAQMKLIRREKRGKKVSGAVKVAQAHAFIFEPFAYMSEHEELQRLARAKAGEESAEIF